MQIRKKNIAVIMGGYSSEYDISIKSGNVVARHLDPEKFDVFKVIISKSGWYAELENGSKPQINRHDFSYVHDGKTIYFDCVFNAIHGTPGEDGLMQAYFELLGIPQTSCGAYQAALTFNKRDLLRVLQPYDIPSATSVSIDQGDEVDVEAILEKVGLPCFVKANRAGSSYGITKVYHADDFMDALDHAFTEDHQVLVESFLDGTEVSVGVITHQGKTLVLPVTEIVSKNDFFDFEAKYEGASEEITPARLTDVQRDRVQNLAKQAYEVLEMSGYTRSEFIFQGDEPHFLEMNTTPGLTEESILPQQAAEAGISLATLFESAIEEALRK